MSFPQTTGGDTQPQARQTASMMGGWLALYGGRGNGRVDEQAYALADAAKGIVLRDHFVAPAAGSLPGWLTTQDTSSGGTPTFGYDAAGLGGTYSFAHDNTDEVQSIGIHGGDTLWIDPTKDCYVECKVKGSALATLSADQRFVFGFASAYAATLDDITRNAWFRVEGGSANLLWEVDDGTTDDDDNDTGIDVVDDTYITLRVVIRDLYVHFVVNGVQVAKSALTVLSGGLQPILIIQKDAGTETDSITVDYIDIASSL
jgi:hypothetical protein